MCFDDWLKNSKIAQELDPATRLFIEGLHTVVKAEERSLEQKKELIKQLLQSFGPSWTMHWKTSYQMKEDRTVKMDDLFAGCCLALERQSLVRALEQLEIEIKGCRDPQEKEILLQEKVLELRD